jgi:hypothetical protein
VRCLFRFSRARSGIAPPRRLARYKETAAPQSPPSFPSFLSSTPSSSFASLPAGLPFWLAAPPLSDPPAAQRHSARPLTGFLPLTDPPVPPSCSYLTLPLPVDPTVGLAIDGDPMYSPLYKTWWLADHAMVPPSASCSWNLTSSSTPRPTPLVPEAPVSP